MSSDVIDNTNINPNPKLSITSTVRLSTGYDMPRIGFGVYQNFSATESTLEALKAGYRLIDTAQVYRNEAHVAAAVRASGIDRKEVFIVTKCVSKTHGYESTKLGLDESLAKMKLDYIDLFLIHDPYSGKKLRLETYKALLEGKAAGKIRSVGVSNYNVKNMEEIVEAGYELPSVNQIELHPFCQQSPIVKYCKAHNIVVQAYCPIIRGKRMDHHVLQDLATKYARDPAQILLRWSLQSGYIPLPKSAMSSRIQSNIDLYGFELTSEEMEILDGLDCGKEGAVSWNPVNVD